MIAISSIAIILLAHWFSDFVMQNDWMAKNKSSNNIALFTHGLVYTLSLGTILLIGSYIFKLDFFGTDIVWFAVINGLLHVAVDYITSRMSSSLYQSGKIGGQIPNLGFFTVIGLDQLIHTLMLFCTYTVIFN